MKILKFLGLTLVGLILLTGLLLYEDDIPKDVVDARYWSPDSQFTEMGDQGRIHFRDEGNRRHFPIVLLHGANASLHTFEPWVKTLTIDYRVITIDLPGHGLTGAVPSADYSTQAMLNVINRIAEHVGIDEFAIGGNSMGGGLAWRYTLAHPEQIKALVLINASGTRAENDAKSHAKLKDRGNGVLGFRLLRQTWFRAFAERLDPYYLIVQGLKASHYRSIVVDETLIMRYYNLTLREGTRRAILDRFKPNYGDEGGDISQITAPALIMWGMEDAIIPFAYASGFESALPHAVTAY
ncbi:MAG: pimeloyl-ACP methyl ester carboxylesterase, partial [Candidatus Azotimanducaceae bacterium]